MNDLLRYAKTLRKDAERESAMMNKQAELKDVMYYKGRMDVLIEVARWLEGLTLFQTDDVTKG